MTDITEQVARALSANWRNVHTNESMGFQRMLAAVAVLAVRAADREAGMVLVSREDVEAVAPLVSGGCDCERCTASYRLRDALEAS